MYSWCLMPAGRSFLHLGDMFPVILVDFLSINQATKKLRKKKEAVFFFQPPFLSPPQTSKTNHPSGHLGEESLRLLRLASSPSRTRMDNFHMFLAQILTMSHHQNHQRSSGKLDCSPFLCRFKIFSKQKRPKMDTHTVFV